MIQHAFTSKKNSAGLSRVSALVVGLWSAAGLLPAANPLTAAALPSATAAMGSLSAADEAFDMRLDFLTIDKGEAAAFQFLEKEFARDPRPHVKAWYAEYLITGKEWGAPEGQALRGIALANEALSAGSSHALRILGWELITGAGKLVEANPERGIDYLQQLVTAKNANGILTLGEVYQRGLGVPANWAEAEQLYRRGAFLGKPSALGRLGAAYEAKAGAGSTEREKACELYYEAASRGGLSAKRRLKELFDQKDPLGVRAYQLLILWYAHLGADFQTRQVRSAMELMESAYPDDPLAILAVARVYSCGDFGYRDFKKSYALYEKAAKLGSDDAQAEAAKLRAEGTGTKKDSMGALATWRELEARQNPRALALLGYYHYWGSLSGAGHPKDAKLAYQYSQRAADLGDCFGQLNVATCYEFGIGVEMNPALAAKYYRTAAWRGYRKADEKMRRLLLFVK